MAGRTVGLDHARGASAWFSASPRVQRLVGAQIAVLLAAGLTGVVAHRAPGTSGEPLALATAVGPVGGGPVAVDDAPSPASVGRIEVSRSEHRPSKAARAARSKKRPPAPPKGWAYWSARIRGCESHGRPDAPPDYQAQNPESTASGAYQILDTTWAGRYGVGHASDATPEQQEAAAADLYKRHGTADWAASAPCWRAPKQKSVGG
jgi:hypothetical protein